MARFQMTINGRDVSNNLSKWGMNYQRIKVQGPNQGVSQGGSLIEDIVKVKDFFSFEGNALDPDTYRFFAAATEAPYVTCTYRQPATGQIVTKQMVATMSAANYLPANNTVWYEHWSLTLEER